MEAMPSLKWSISDAVFVTDIDDEHKVIFQAAADVQKILGSADSVQIRRMTERLVTRMTDHFAHEERLMRASRYESFEWHSKKHETALWRVKILADRMERGDAEAGEELIQYLTTWLHDHARLADRMLGAFLRNKRRMGRLTIRAGTKSAHACTWVGADGEVLDLQNENGG